MGAALVSAVRSGPSAGDADNGTFRSSRKRLIAELKRLGITDTTVLAALDRVPRHQFVDASWSAEAYKNKPLPIGLGQTISQPYTVALMTQLLFEGGAKPKKVLEVGTGSGYQTAVLAECVEAVFSVERIRSLSESARIRLRQLGYRNIHFGYSDGRLGWSAHAPFDAIIVTAGASSLPEKLVTQLSRRGRLIIPLSEAGEQRLIVLDKRGSSSQRREITTVNFVPLLGGKA